MGIKKVIIIALFALLILLGIYFFIPNNKSVNEDTSYNTNNKADITEYKNTIEELEFLKSISGMKAKNIELIDNPIGIKGEFLAPSKSILNGVDYFLKHTENNKMENIKIDLGNGYISIKVDYKITNKITTPIEVKIIPLLNMQKDLELKIEEFKFLELKISNWIVNIILSTFIKDWFPKDEDINIEFKEGVVVIYKDNFNGINLNSLKVEETGLNINMIIDLNTILKNINSKNK